jgi:hypothetical protein
MASSVLFIYKFLLCTVTVLGWHDMQCYSITKR